MQLTLLNNLSKITATILAGGLGTRLRSVVSGKPKVLAKVNGRPFMAYLLDQLSQAGVKKVVLCTGYLGEQVKATFGKFYNGLALSYSQEQSAFGTGGALRIALPLLKSEPVLVLNGDSFCQTDFIYFLNQHITRKATASLLLTEVPDIGRYGSVHLSVDGEIISFEEKGKKTGIGLINAGVYLLNHTFLESIPKDTNVSLEHEIFPLWISKGLYGFRSKGNFIDIGVPQDYAAAGGFLKSSIKVSSIN
ncbi:MAG: galactokinase [Candidatus Brocadia sp. AMX2]|nr:MAG: galactokinase [Candidatus Brocadia sp. AMX2]MBC6932105.1 galactokinase [Candidatus Brocadia sp.]MBL1168796.1 galactokinase [Candidatus Brocadia sp. AMX1]NOG42856.1 NTP transferase domain-containing protein [Planctomycetota bacterium]NUO04849.1 NTP transferase domain-containing protein [Candidatus Brocadia sinica]